MRIDTIMQSLKMLAHADSLIADITFRRRLNQIALNTAALIVALFGLIMVGIAGYQWLRDLLGPAFAALAIAAASFLLAVCILLLAASRKPGKEIAMAREMHEAALASLVSEARGASGDLLPLGALLRGRLDGTLLSLVGPLAALLLRLLKRHQDDVKPQA